ALGRWLKSSGKPTPTAATPVPKTPKKNVVPTPAETKKTAVATPVKGSFVPKRVKASAKEDRLLEIAMGFDP
ncbi:unnamed protein product, partial [Prorocentrum cordatum]